MIRFFAQHRTAANLLLALMVVCGITAVGKINRQFFPDFGIDIVTVSVSWPGASASDIEQNIIQSIEPELRFLNGVKKIVSTAYEGRASVSIEFHPGHSMQEALSDIESAVGQVSTLPDDAERPEIKRIVRYESISKLVISGDFSDRSLKERARQIRDDLLERGIDRVDLYGIRRDEIWVDLKPDALYQYDLELRDVADTIRATSQDVPAGELGGGESQVRSLGLLTKAREIAQVEIKALPDGRRILLGDISGVSESYREEDNRLFRHGKNAIELDIKRSINTDALDSSETVSNYVEELNSTLPPQIQVEQYDVRAKSIRQRIDLLLRNGIGGLVLVLAVLFLFLNTRVAIWVAIGIPASLLATVAVMWASGQTINMISLFGMIMAIGIVVDDAIVVGEHAAYQFRQGLSSLEASVKGATRMAAPVLASTMTTVAAFLPLFIISGIMGQIISAIPFVVVAVLVASLIECFLVLPAHLAHSLKRENVASENTGFRAWFDSRFEQFKELRFKRFTRFAVRNRYATAVFAVVALIISVGAVFGGRVGYQFFPSPEAETIYANLEMRKGTSREETRRAILAVEASLYGALTEMGVDPNDLLVMALAKTGISVGTQGGRMSFGSDSTLAGVHAELVSSEERDVKASEVIKAWRNAVPVPNNASSLTFEAQRSGPPGGDLDVRLLGGSVVELKEAAEEVALLLRKYGGVSDIKDNLPYGKPETHIELNSRGRALGFSTVTLASQVRDAVDGIIAKRFPRGEEEVWIRVQYDRQLVRAGLLNQLYVRAPNGSKVKLLGVADFKKETGFSSIRRENGQREVSIRAEVDMTITRPQYLRHALVRDGLEDICNRYGLTYKFGGRALDEKETTSDMLVGTVLGLVFIYIILAWVFSSYVRPLVIMAVIPTGFVGAVLGHAVWGFDLTILSIFAILGLSGIVINDSIILVKTVDERTPREGLLDAVVNGSGDRLRAVILTSATTIGGLLPLLFETSLQAQFLIPMALTLVFGLALTTPIVLVLIPSLIVIEDDICRFFRQLSVQKILTKDL
jgi:multidrug efflux pump subunit AcrB